MKRMPCPDRDKLRSFAPTNASFVHVGQKSASERKEAKLGVFTTQEDPFWLFSFTVLFGVGVVDWKVPSRKDICSSFRIEGWENVRGSSRILVAKIVNDLQKMASGDRGQTAQWSWTKVQMPYFLKLLNFIEVMPPEILNIPFTNEIHRKICREASQDKNRNAYFRVGEKVSSFLFWLPRDAACILARWKYEKKH